MNRRRLTWWSVPWLVGILGYIGYELAAVLFSWPGGTLTQVVQWARGDHYGFRWWLLAGFLAWLVPHFLWDGIGAKWLTIPMTLALAAWLALRLT